MVFQEIIGIKKSYQLFFYLNQLVIKQKKGLNVSYVEVFSSPYGQIGELSVKQNFLGTVLHIGNVDLSFTDPELIDTAKSLIKLGQENPQLLQKYLGADNLKIELSAVNKDDIEKDILNGGVYNQPPQTMSNIPPAPPVATKSVFSPELEQLIQATLEDGVLEDYEKAALVKRAIAEGVDIAELEIYINSILQKRQKEAKKESQMRAKEQAEAKKAQFGRICPNCGRQIPSMTLKCECGYEVTNNSTASSVQVLSDKILKLNESEMPEIQRIQSIRTLISTFPVPNTKEDIIEFLSLAASKAQQDGSEYHAVYQKIKTYLIRFGIVFAALMTLLLILGARSLELTQFSVIFLVLGGIGLVISSFKAFGKSGKEITERKNNSKIWKAKFDQVLMKGRSLRGDSDFQKQLDYYENYFNK